MPWFPIFDSWHTYWDPILAGSQNRRISSLKSSMLHESNFFPSFTGKLNSVFANWVFNILIILNKYLLFQFLTSGRIRRYNLIQTRGWYGQNSSWKSDHYMLKMAFFWSLICKVEVNLMSNFFINILIMHGKDLFFNSYIVKCIWTVPSEHGVEIAEII